VDAAQPGGIVVISPGVYEEAVVVTTPFLTIRGLDRNRVILEGGFTLDNGISVIEADGVTIENMTARHYLVNGFLWSSVFGYRGSYLTAFNDGDHGLFAFDSEFGQFDHSYASGHPDSGFYIGQCSPCHAVITDVLAENNAVGYSGTNAGGDLFVVNSEWRDNLAGIVPNTLDSEELAPQHDALIAGNWVHDNNNADAPSFDLEYPSLGIGIIVNGGRDNLVTQNLVEDHEAFGIALLPSPDEDVWLTQGNEVRDNLVRNSGRADLALGAPSGGGDCFSGNDFSTSLPPAIEWRAGCGSPLARIPGGSLGAIVGPLERYLAAALGDVPAGDWRSQPRSEMWPWATGVRSRRRRTRNRCRAPRAPRPTRRSPRPPFPNPSASATPARSTCRRHPTSLRRSPCSGSRSPRVGGVCSSACTPTRCR
jgi:hypothetical protein